MACLVKIHDQDLAQGPYFVSYGMQVITLERSWQALSRSVAKTLQDFILQDVWASSCHIFRDLQKISQDISNKEQQITHMYTGLDRQTDMTNQTDLFQIIRKQIKFKLQSPTSS